QQSAVSACMAARMNSRLATMYFVGMGSGSPGTNWQAKTCDSGDGYKKLGEIQVYGEAWTNNIFTTNPQIQFSTSSDLSTFTGPAQYNYGSTRICGNKPCPSNITSSGVDQFTTSTSSSYMSAYPYSFVPYQTCGGLSLYRHMPSYAGNVMTYVSCS